MFRLPTAPGLALAVLIAVNAPGCAAAPGDDAGDPPPAVAEWIDARLDDVPRFTYDRLLAADSVGRIELRPELIIGERAGDPRYSFGGPAPSVALDDSGRIFVLDPGNHRVAVFSAVGEFLYQFGSRGEGPGEFPRAVRGQIGFLGTRLFISFPYLRAGFWDADGTFLEPFDDRVFRRTVVHPLDDGTLIGGHWTRDTRPRKLALARHAVSGERLAEVSRYALAAAWARPSFAARGTGELYVSGLTGRHNDVVAFDADATPLWASRFRWPPDAGVLPSQLLLDGNGRVYVLPGVNRNVPLPDDFDRLVDVLSPEGEWIGSATIADFQIGIVWQQVLGDYVFGAEENPETYEWQVVRYRLDLPFDEI